jgi:quinol monooxygenase YgiN
MTVFALRVTTNLSSRTEVLRCLTTILGLTRAQPGCSSCKIYSDIEEPKAVLLLQEWVTDADLVRYLGSDGFRPVLTAIELAGAAPEIHVDRVETRGGIEVIESARLH